MRLDPLSTPLLDSIQFADGTAMTYQDVLDQGFEFEGTEEDDVIDGTAVTDRIDAKGGNDNVSGRTGDDSIFGGAGNDVLLGEAGQRHRRRRRRHRQPGRGLWRRRARGDEDEDELFGGGGNDVLGGGADDDRLTGDGGDDVLTGGTGNDVLIGSDGSDVYTFAIGDGQDTIDDQGVLTASLFDTASVDVVRFAEGITIADVTLLARGNGDLVIRYSPDDRVTVKGQYRIPGNAIERIEFADGTVFGSSALNAVPIMPIAGTTGNDVLYGTDGSDTLLGLAGDDVLDGGRSPDEAKSPALLTDNDRLEGGAGADTYAMYLGMGADTIVDSSASVDEISTLKLAPGLTLDSIRTLRRGDDLFVSLRSGQEGALIAGYYDITAPTQNWQVDDRGRHRNVHRRRHQPPRPQRRRHCGRGDGGLQAEPAFELERTLAERSVADPCSRVQFLVADGACGIISDPNLPPQVLVLNPVTSQFIENFGIRQGGAFATALNLQTLVTPVFVSQESDNAVIQTQGFPQSIEEQLRYGVTLGSVARNVSGSVSTSSSSTSVTVQKHDHHFYQRELEKHHPYPGSRFRSQPGVYCLTAHRGARDRGNHRRGQQ